MSNVEIQMTSEIQITNVKDAGLGGGKAAELIGLLGLLGLLEFVGS
jgi:hypothetical protein